MSTEGNTYDEDADFALGFESTEAEPASTAALTTTAPPPEPPKTAAPEDKTAVTDPPKTESETPAVDPFAGLPEAVRNMLAEIPRMRGEVETLRRQAAQVPGLQAKLDKIEARTAPASEPAAKPRFEKVEKLRDAGLEDIADAMAEIAAALPGEQTAPKTDEPAAPAAAPKPPPASSTNDDPVLAMLDELRPSWGADLNSNDFQLYLTQQPKAIQTEVMTTGNPAVIIRHLKAFDEFKARTTQPPPAQPSQRQQRLAAAIAPRGDGRGAARTASVLDDEDEGMQAGFYNR